VISLTLLCVRVWVTAAPCPSPAHIYAQAVEPGGKGNVLQPSFGMTEILTPESNAVKTNK
jgi:hypothetical protein